MKNKKTVLIFTKEKNADRAQAVKDYLSKDSSVLAIIIGEDEFTGIATRIIRDRLFNEDGFIYRSYENILNHISLRFIDKIPKQEVSFKSNDPVCKKALNILVRFNPDLIILNDSCAFKEILAARNKAMPDVKIAMIVGDYVLNSRLINKNVNKYFVDNMAIKTTLVNNCIPENDVYLTDLPMPSSFDEPFDKDKIFDEYGFSRDNEFILLSVPQISNKGINEAIDTLKEYRERFNILVDCGKDRDMLGYARESGLKAINEGRDSAPFYELSRIVISRPETMTIAKSLYKDCLFVALEPQNELERRVLAYMEENLVKTDKTVATLRSVINKYIENASEFEQIKANADTFAELRPRGQLFKSLELLLDMGKD